MGFKNDYSQASQGNSLKPEGDYECIITVIEERITKNGAKGLDFTFVIRNDVSGQKYGNACLFHTIWRKKEPNEFDMQVEGYNFNQLMAIGKAAQLPDGKDYENLKQYCEDLLNKCIRVTLKHESNPDYRNGEPQERIRYFNPTKYPECRHKFKQAAAPGGFEASNRQLTGAQPEKFSEYELSDDGVPF